MTIPFRKFVVAGVLMLWVSTVAAQSDCPTIVQNALSATDAACHATSRNQACYGNITLQAEPQEGAPAFQFSSPGDIVDVAGVRTLRLQPLDATADIWGVALMQLQASLPETLPGQNVTFLLFGDVEINNAVDANSVPVTLEAISNGAIDVRSGPSTDHAAISQLASGAAVSANGRSPDGLWLRVQLPDGTPGWVSANTVTLQGDLSSLALVDPLALPPAPLTPMQAFYFKSGVGDAPCAEAPDSGILIQTPEGVGKINLTVNEVDIQLGSTAYLQAQPSGDMTINVVENQATVTAGGATQLVLAGSRVRVPLDANLAASGPPSPPESYDNAALAALPVGHMPRVVAVAPALTQAELDALSASGLPVSGEWFYESPTAALSGSCPSNTPDTPPRSRVITLDVDENFSAEVVLRAETPGFPFPESAVYANPEPGYYTADWDLNGDVFHLEMRFTSPTSAEGSTTDTFQGCTFSTTFTLTAQ